MVNANQDHLQPDSDEVSEPISPLLGTAGTPPLDPYLSRICDRIKADGLSSLYWVSGIHTRELVSGLLEALSAAGNQELARPADNRCILIKTVERRVTEPFRLHFGCKIFTMQDSCVDSFLIVNEAAVLDVTPVTSYDGLPEYNEDPIIVDLYVNLFNLLKERSMSVYIGNWASSLSTTHWR